MSCSNIMAHNNLRKSLLKNQNPLFFTRTKWTTYSHSNSSQRNFLNHSHFHTQIPTIFVNPTTRTPTFSLLFINGVHHHHHHSQILGFYSQTMQFPDTMFQVLISRKVFWVMDLGFLLIVRNLNSYQLKKNHLWDLGGNFFSLSFIYLNFGFYDLMKLTMIIMWALYSVWLVLL